MNRVEIEDFCIGVIVAVTTILTIALFWLVLA